MGTFCHQQQLLKEPKSLPVIFQPSKEKKKSHSQKSPSLQLDGPAPTYHEGEPEEVRGRSRKVGSTGARSRSLQLRPRRPLQSMWSSPPPPHRDGSSPCGTAAPWGKETSSRPR